MKTQFYKLIIVMAFAITTNLFGASSTQFNRTLVLIDISDSSPFIMEQKLTKNVSKYIYSHIQELPIPSKINLSFVGNFMSNKMPSKTYIIDRKHPKSKIGKGIYKNIMKLSKQMKKESSEYKAESTTEILSALEIATMENHFNTIIIYSDMLEYGSTMNMYKIVSGVSNEITYLPTNCLNNSKIIILGAGVGLKNSNMKKFQKLKSIWLGIFKKSGAKDIKFFTNNFF